jgi:hypothetical protein
VRGTFRLNTFVSTNFLLFHGEIGMRSNSITLTVALFVRNSSNNSNIYDKTSTTVRFSLIKYIRESDDTSNVSSPK